MSSESGIEVYVKENCVLDAKEFTLVCKLDSEWKNIRYQNKRVHVKTLTPVALETGLLSSKKSTDVEKKKLSDYYVRIEKRRLDAETRMSLERVWAASSLKLNKEDQKKLRPLWKQSIEDNGPYFNCNLHPEAVIYDKFNSIIEDVIDLNNKSLTARICFSIPTLHILPKDIIMNIKIVQMQISGKYSKVPTTALFEAADMEDNNLAIEEAPEDGQEEEEDLQTPQSQFNEVLIAVAGEPGRKRAKRD